MFLLIWGPILLQCTRRCESVCARPTLSSTVALGIYSNRTELFLHYGVICLKPLGSSRYGSSSAPIIFTTPSLQ